MQTRQYQQIVNYGDFPDSFICAPVLHATMSTAIVRIYVRDGFLVAADGLMSDDLGIHDTAYNTQKIFPVQSKLAFCVTGLVRLGSDRAGAPDFSFPASIGDAIEVASAATNRTLQEFCGECASKIYSQLEYFFDKRKILPGEQLPGERGSTILEVMADGYYRDFPSRARIRFYHEESKLAPPEVSSVELYEELPMTKGVPRIGDLLSKRDPSVSRYLRTMPLVGGSVRLTDAAIFARAYIEACSGPEGLAIDERASRGIGGHIHMAVITPTGGFHWVPGFEPLEQQP
jgi:hypothetical protein